MADFNKLMSLLEGAYDVHVHAAPDVVARAQDAMDLARQASEARMAGLGIKDHMTSTVGRVHVLNQLHSAGPRFFSSVVLNPPVGGLNPSAVEAALQAGVYIVYLPTYSARHHVECLGGSDKGFSVLDEAGALLPAVESIVEMVAGFDAVLATGHLSPRESLILLKCASARAAKRMLVTHASESVPSMSVEDQLKAVGMGAYIEHSFFAATEICPGAIPLEQLRDQIRAVGPEHVILSSDFGQPGNGPAVAGFAHYLSKLHRLGVSDEDIRLMIVDNPRTLLGERRPRDGMKEERRDG